MVFLESFHFIRPYALLLLIPVLVLALRQQAYVLPTLWQSIFDPVLLKACLVQNRHRYHLFWRWMPWGVAAICIIALSGPTWQKVQIPLLESQVGRVVLLDLSQSMLAQDLKPDRLTRAKQKIQDFLQIVKEGQVALVGFAAEPFVISPLTSDFENIASQLSVLTPELMPQQGTSITRAILKAQELLKQSHIVDGQIILLTDSVEEDDLKNAQRILSADGQFLSIIGVGTEMGAPIPKPGGGFFQLDNQLVVSVLTRDRLKQLASNYSYQDISLNDDDIKSILSIFKSSNLLKESRLKQEAWYDVGPFLLLITLPFVAFIFRRGILVLFIFYLLPYEESHAIDWWQRADQKAYQETLKGIEAYDVKAFEEAKLHFANPQDAIGYYNLGNSLARLGDYRAAIEAYEAALKRDPSLQDAAYNRDLLKEEMKQSSGSNQSLKSNGSSESNQASESNQSSQSNHFSNKNASESNKFEPQSQSETNDINNGDSTSNETKERRHKENQDKQEAMNETPQDIVSDKSSKDEGALHDIEKIPELKRVPDDPGGLWRRKFLYQYQKQYPNELQSGRPW